MVQKLMAMTVSLVSVAIIDIQPIASTLSLKRIMLFL